MSKLRRMKELLKNSKAAELNGPELEPGARVEVFTAEGWVSCSVSWQTVQSTFVRRIGEGREFLARPEVCPLGTLTFTSLTPSRRVHVAWRAPR